VRVEVRSLSHAGGGKLSYTSVKRFYSWRANKEIDLPLEGQGTKQSLAGAQTIAPIIVSIV